MKKLTLLATAAAGYVLGARAGRGRYDQITTQASKVWHNPTVQDVVTEAQTQAKHAGAEAGSRVGSKVAEAASGVASKVTDTVTGSHAGPPVDETGPAPLGGNPS